MSLRMSRWMVAGLFTLTACAVEGDDVGTSQVQAAVGRPDAVANRYYVGFKTRPAQAARGLVQAFGARVTADFADVDALEIEAGPGADLGGLGARGEVAYIEPVPMRYKQSLADAELVPATTNGLYGLLSVKATNVHGLSSTVGPSALGAGVKACVADTSLEYTHPDIAPNYAGGIDTVGVGDNDPINDDGETHGTHVAGTILGAINDVGVRGVAPGATLYHARVLGPNGGSTSDIMEGVDWLQKQGCKVINLSLGGGLKSRTEETFYKSIRSKGTIVVAATGNDSKRSVSYPAGYTVNIAVGAVDANNVVASFSNTGSAIDVVAPGVLVLSSVPAGTGSEAAVRLDTTSYRAFGFEFAGHMTALAPASVLVDCGLGSPGECPASVAGNIALIQRGSISFADKVTNATAQGATAVIIYNNVAGDFKGTLGTAGTWIPAVAVSDTTGAALKVAAGKNLAANVINIASDWDHYDGTSMATPHVTGTVALIWANNPALTADQVENRLKNNALDLGARGFDSTYGYGLVNACKAAGFTAQQCN